MAKTIVHTDKARTVPMYSQAVKAAGLVFVSGQGPYDPATGEVVGTTIQEQARQSFTNVAAILEAAGSSLEKVVSATFLLGDESDFDSLNEEWVRWFPTEPPARQGARLPARPKNIRISIGVIAEA